jgi:hypothetical protein
MSASPNIRGCRFASVRGTRGKTRLRRESPQLRGEPRRVRAQSSAGHSHHSPSCCKAVLRCERIGFESGQRVMGIAAVELGDEAFLSPDAVDLDALVVDTHLDVQLRRRQAAVDGLADCPGRSVGTVTSIPDSFDARSSQRSAAERWLRTAPSPSKSSAARYRPSRDNRRCPTP